MKSKVIFVMFLCLLVLSFGTMPVLAADRYIWITSTDTLTLYLDTKTIKVVRPTYGEAYVDVGFYLSITKQE